MRSTITVAVILVTAFASAGRAAITYVDAVPNTTGVDGNTTVNGGLVVFGTNASTGTTTSATDGLWGYRTGFANPSGTGRVWEALESSNFPSPLVTTITGLTPGTTYNLYGMFWTDSSGTPAVPGAWDVGLRIGSSGAFTNFLASNSTLSTTTSTEFATTVLTREGNRWLYIATIGQYVATATGSVDIYASTVAGNSRTWYDGVGYEVAVTCQLIPAVIVQRPVAPGAATVTVTGVSPNATSIKVYVGGTTLVGTAAGSPPNTPSSVAVPLSTTLKFGDSVSARQVVSGLEDCGPNTAVSVAAPRITYVDAVANTTGSNGNTTINGALVDFTAGTGNATTSIDADPNADGLWHTRTSFANGGAIWECNDPSLLTPVITTLTLAPGTYNLYGLVWTDVSGTALGTWDVGFRVGATGSYTVYGLGGMASTTAGGDEFVNTVLAREGNRWLVIASLGQYTVGGSVDIYAIAPAGAGRTWYDGVGYELVSPAPGLPLLDGFGDGDRNNDGVLDDPDGSGGGIVDNGADQGLKWWRVFLSGTENQTVRVTHDLAGPGGLGDDNVLQVNVTGNQAYQLAGIPPTLLAEPRDFIRLSVQVRFTTMVDSRDTLRFGLFSDGAKTVASDALTPDIIQDDYGYLATVATGSIGATARIATNYPWGADGSIFGVDENIATQTPFARMINDSLPHSLSLTVVRSFGDYALFLYTIDGSTALLGEDISTPAMFFNEIGFGSVPNPGISYDLDDVLVEKGTTAVCEAIPPVTPESLIPGGTTTVDVNNVIPQAEQVNVYVDGTLIGSAAGSPPNTTATVTVNLSQSPVSGTVTAKQVVNGVESCLPPTGVLVNDCKAVAAVSAPGSLLAGDTSVTVTGINVLATAVSVYVNGTTLVGTATTNGATSTAVLTTPLPQGARVSATQTIRGVESCIPTGLLVLNTKLTYVDAVPNTTGSDGNTTINGALVNFTNAPVNATTAVGGQSAAQSTDGLWHMRQRSSESGGTVNGAGVWESDTAADEVTALLVTRLSLPAGSYNLYGVLWNNSNDAGIWDADFRVGSAGAFTTFDKSNALLARLNGSEFTNAVVTRDGTDAQVALIAPLGRYKLDGPIDIYVNGGGPAATDARTWFDGVAYSEACSDPFADLDGDSDVDQMDFGIFQNCFTGDGFNGLLGSGCNCLDRAINGNIGLADLNAFLKCVSGPMLAADPTCDD